MEQRRARRFQLELPLSVTRTGTVRVMLAGTTKNVSSTGVLFTAPRVPEPGGSIEYIITLNHELGLPVHLRCVGKIVRAEDISNGDGPQFRIAATLERYEFVRDHSRVEHAIRTSA